MIYRVEFTARAEAEARAIHEYIAEQSPNYADRWHARLSDAVESLARFPLRCRRAPESRVFREPLRQLPLGNYRILFVVREQTVFVLHVRHAARRRMKRGEIETP